MAGPAGRARRLRSHLLRWVGPALFAALWWYSDLGQIRSLLGRTRVLPLAAAAALNAVIIVVKAWRWRGIMREQGIAYGYGASARAYTIASALAAWTPGRLGDFVKALNVSRDVGVSFGRAASSVIADRLLDALALTLVAAAGAVLLLGAVAGIVAWCLVALAVVIAWILYRWAGTARPGGAERALDKVGLARAGRELGEAIAGLEEMTRSSGRRTAAAASIGTIAAALLAFLQGWMVAVSVGMDVSFARLAAALSAASIASLLPLSVSGIGIREATMVFFLGPAGIGLGEVLTYSLTFLIVVNGSAALMGAAAHAFWPAPAARRDVALEARREDGVA